MFSFYPFLLLYLMKDFLFFFYEKVSLPLQRLFPLWEGLNWRDWIHRCFSFWVPKSSIPYLNFEESHQSLSLLNEEKDWTTFHVVDPYKKSIFMCDKFERWVHTPYSTPIWSICWIYRFWNLFHEEIWNLTIYSSQWKLWDVWNSTISS